MWEPLSQDKKMLMEKKFVYRGKLILLLPWEVKNIISSRHTIFPVRRSIYRKPCPLNVQWILSRKSLLSKKTWNPVMMRMAIWWWELKNSCLTQIAYWSDRTSGTLPAFFFIVIIVFFLILKSSNDNTIFLLDIISCRAKDVDNFLNQSIY